MTRLQITIALLLVLLSAWSLWDLDRANDECKKKNGVLVRGPFSMECVQKGPKCG